MSPAKLRQVLLAIAVLLSAAGLVMFLLSALEGERAATGVLQAFSPLLGGVWGAVLGARGHAPEKGKVLVWAMMGAFACTVLVGLGVVVVWPRL